MSVTCPKPTISLPEAGRTGFPSENQARSASARHHRGASGRQRRCTDNFVAFHAVSDNVVCRSRRSDKRCQSAGHPSPGLVLRLQFAAGTAPDCREEEE